MISSNEHVGRIDIQTKLSTLWVVLLFNMTFADIVGFAAPGAIEDLMTLSSEGANFGGVEGVVVTPGLLLVAAVFIEIAILMVFLSRVLPHKTNRIANLGASVLTAVFVIGGGSMKLHYVFFASIEIATLLAIVVLVWGWTNES